jgi:DNA-binding NtrC family response regulator
MEIWKQQYHAYGAFDYISKPPDLNRLLNTVRNALDKATHSRK